MTSIRANAILVGLELLVAADIISSVAINPTFATVGVLGLIVLIRIVHARGRHLLDMRGVRVLQIKEG